MALMIQKRNGRKEVLDITKIQKLGWKPEINIKQGFKKTINSYKKLKDVK